METDKLDIARTFFSSCGLFGSLSGLYTFCIEIPLPMLGKLGPGTFLIVTPPNPCKFLVTSWGKTSISGLGCLFCFSGWEFWIGGYKVWIWDWAPAGRDFLLAEGVILVFWRNGLLAWRLCSCNGTVLGKGLVWAPSLVFDATIFLLGFAEAPGWFKAAEGGKRVCTSWGWLGLGLEVLNCLALIFEGPGGNFCLKWLLRWGEDCVSFVGGNKVWVWDPGLDLDRVEVALVSDTQLDLGFNLDGPWNDFFGALITPWKAWLLSGSASTWLIVGTDKASFW